jgi:hypothetical protein
MTSDILGGKIQIRIHNAKLGKNNTQELAMLLTSLQMKIDDNALKQKVIEAIEPGNKNYNVISYH